MLAFPSMLTEPAARAGIAVPEDVDCYSPGKYPHFYVFCAVRLGQSMPHPSAHWDNARAIAAIPLDKITQVSMSDLVEDYGFQIGQPIP